MAITFNEIIGLLLGAVFIIWAFKKRNHRLQLLQKGVTAEGKVVSIQRVTTKDSDGDSYRYRPVIVFPISKTETVTKTPEISTYPCPYQVGDKVNVTYDPANIDDFTLNDGPAMTFEIILFGLGIIAMIYVAIQFFITH